MSTKFWMLDGRDVWHKPCLEVARARGYDAQLISQGHHASGGYGFIRPHADPNLLECHKVDFMLMGRGGCKMIQDSGQVMNYENKSAQFWRWGKWMPQTWRFGSKTEALAAAAGLPMPIVSKADEGASSTNIRIINTHAELKLHICMIFDKGLKVDHCSGGYLSKQRDYVLLQEFIPHQSTYRVNRIGNSYAIFLRHCYKNKPVAQTGNTTPVVQLDAITLAAIHKARSISDNLASKWIALDLLWCEKRQDFVMLETSLAWPTDGFKQAKFWSADGQPTRRSWGEIWDVLFDEIEGGSWG